jgi:short-subunit dehydrogenase
MKTFLSIGSGPGIGLATAERFAAEGYRIILTSRNQDKLEGLSTTLKGKGYTSETATLDVSDPNAIKALIAGLTGKYGTIEVMHYNAASLRQATIANQPAESFASDLAINIAGAMVAIQAVAGPMAKGGEGTILLTGGGFGLAPSPDFISLSIGKAGLRTLALGLFDTLKDKGIHIGVVNVAAMVAPNSQTSVNIASEFWALHNTSKDKWLAEVTYSE